MINLRLSFQTFALLLSFCVVVPASAQVGGMNGPGNTPTFSPYINLLREGGGVGQNYFGLVRPQVDFAQQNQMLGQGINALQANQMQQGRMVGGYGYTQLGATGHAVMFGSINGGRHQGGYIGMAGGGGMKLDDNGEQSLRGLLLHRTATVNLKPELEIFADDVKCAHGSTIGQIDKTVLFYLRSRGIDLASARELLTYAFLNEILDRVPTEELRDRLTHRITGHAAESPTSLEDV